MIKTFLKKTFFYKIYRNSLSKKRMERVRIMNEAFKREAGNVLKLYSDALINNNIMFWIDYGTLLGYYREKDFIKHDFDLDTGAWYEDHEKIKKALEKSGFERVRYYYLKNRDGMEECYKHRDYMTTIDVFYYFNENDKSYCFSFQPMVSMRKKRHLNKIQHSKARKWVFDKITLIPSEFKGVKVYVPQNTEKYLKSTYGETFMTPIPNLPLKGRPNMIEYSYEEMPACTYMTVGYFEPLFNKCSKL